MDTPGPRIPPRGARDVRVDPESRPGWITGTERLPGAGEPVFTNEGPAVVVRVVGKIGGGGTLLELTMDDGRKHAFFAAASNVLVSPEEYKPGSAVPEEPPAVEPSSSELPTSGFLT